MSKSGGVFQIDDVTRTMSKGGGAPGVPPIQVQTPPTWLAGYGPGIVGFHLDVYVYGQKPHPIGTGSQVLNNYNICILRRPL